MKNYKQQTYLGARIVALFGLFLMLYSCSSMSKLTYLNEMPVDQKEEINQHYELKIKKDDILVIDITCESPDLALPFKQKYLPTSPTEIQAGNSSTPSQPNTYLVNALGEIQFPILGSIQVEGMTHKELSDEIKKMIIEGGYINDLDVEVRLQNFKVIVLGDVSSPGVKTFTSDRVTIFDLIAASGDITSSGQKKQIHIVREEHGERVLTHLDVTTGEVFDSEYYYLQQNDIVYVKPNKKSARESDNIPQDRYFTFIISIITSLASMAIGVFLFQ